MSKFVCKDGVLTLSGGDFSADVLEVNTVTFDFNAAVHEYEVMTEGWLVRTGGVKSWSATAETAWDSALGVDMDYYIGTTVTFSYNSTDGLTVAGSVVVESVAVSAPVDGYSTASWSFQGNGEPTEG